MADPKPSEPRIEPHPLVEALVPDPSQPPERTTKLFGYPGRSPNESETRLWLDLDLTSYVDVPDDAILHSRTLPDDGGTILWVRTDAQLRYASVSSHAAQADFLSGSIATSHLGGAAGAPFPFPGPGPIPPTFPGTGCPPPPTFDYCPSRLGPCLTIGATLAICCHPSLYPGAPCPTAPSMCCPPSVYPHLCPPSVFPVHCPPPTFPVHCPPSVLYHLCQTSPVLCRPPSVLIACPSVLQHVCPTSPLICHPVTSPLTCHTRICPSEAIPCHTGPGCPMPTLGCPFGPEAGPGPIG